ncbi:MAG: nitroreductase family protein [Planctomycetaceae bacterium]|jgi:nitroreductase|nr:nitroreductase family protein [Planctomycetaceae bacterium]
MDELFQVIATRHSYRGEFKSDPVDMEHLKKIVQAGIDAPSGCNAQTTHFVIVTEPKLLDEISTYFENRTVCKTAKAMIVCITDLTPAYGDTSFAREDCAAAVENMLLAISALGYATVWYQGYVQKDQTAEKIAKLLNVPNNLHVEILLPIGIPATQESPRPKKSFAERAFFNRYGAK